MTTAFVLSGGGSLGAVQVGMLQALGSAGVLPDLLIGTSVGAVNAAWVAGHGMSPRSLAGLEQVWSRLRRRDVFPLRAHHLARGVLGGAAAICSPERLGQLVRLHAGYADLADASIPVHMVATDLLSGLPVVLSTGPVEAAVVASAAVPGVFPPVVLEGRHLVDGGVAGRGGVSHAVELGADEIYVLPAGVACALPHPPRTAVGIAMHALTLVIEQRLATEIAKVSHRSPTVRVRVLPPLCPLGISATDFSHSADLVGRGRESSTRWIASGALDLPDQERFLALHEHRRLSDDQAPSTGLPASVCTTRVSDRKSSSPQPSSFARSS